MMSLNLVENNGNEDEDDSEVFELRFEVEYKIGDIVYIRTDTEQKPRMVLAYYIHDLGVLYVLAQSTTETNHYAIEISKEIDRIITSTN